MFANETLMSVAKVLMDEDKLLTLIDGELIAEGNLLMLCFALPSSAIKALLTRKGSPMSDDNL
ncbi:hypothetical protein [Sphingobacterium bambusae]|uniref:Uncharacterized protein n=1 Tax=Sphingobacterium bambusae TaxID=662858 RepID=A0ABW6BGH4_9SPHI|nr:hypothetical protein [Sphingobacterium bambusae]WPL47296.1 hypothetical protein SCB77_15160 [Sphingobacterium bambusae]